MKKELIISIALHVAVALLLTFGSLPTRTLKDEEILVPMEVVSLGDITQSNKPASAAIKVDEPKPEPPKPVEEAPKLPENKAQPTPQPPKSDGVVEEKNPEKDDKEEAQKEDFEPEELLEEDVAEEEPEEEVFEEVIPEEKPKEPENPKEKPKPKEAPKPKPKPKAPKKEEVKKKKLNVQNILKNLVESKTSPAAKSEDSQEEETTSNEDGDDLPKGNEMTMTELAAVKQQLARCWKVDVGAKGIGDMKIPLHIQFNRDLSIKKVDVIDQDRLHADAFYQAAARRAINALHAPECTPLKLPLRKYEQWKDFKVTFDPKQMAGGQ